MHFVTRSPSGERQNRARYLGGKSKLTTPTIVEDAPVEIPGDAVVENHVENSTSLPLGITLYFRARAENPHVHIPVRK